MVHIGNQHHCAHHACNTQVLFWYKKCVATRLAGEHERMSGLKASRDDGEFGEHVAVVPMRKKISCVEESMGHETSQ